MVTGFATAGFNNKDFGLARCNSDGSLDATFGSGGKVTDFGIGSPTSDLAWSVVFQQDGKIVPAVG